MPVAFRESDDPAGPGRAAFLRILSDGDNRRLNGALLITNAIGEPIELAFARIESPASMFCADRRASSHAARLLAIALFENCRTTPHVLLFLDDEVNPELFEHRIRVEIPAVAVSAPSHSSEPVWRWIANVRPEPDLAALTIDRLVALGLVMEPFERAARALDAAIVGAAAER